MAKAKGWNRADFKAAQKKRSLMLSGLCPTNNLPDGTRSTALRGPIRGEAASAVHVVLSMAPWSNHRNADSFRRGGIADRGAGQEVGR